MRHYHCCAGMTKTDMVLFAKGRDILVSYASRSHLKDVADVCRSFILDNGAYTFFQSGKGEIDYEGYLDWCYEWYRHPNFAYAIIPDKINGTPQENEDLFERFPGEIRGMGVWHMQDPLEWLELQAEMCLIVGIGKGGFPRNDQIRWHARMAEAMASVCDEKGRPLVPLHGLGMLDPKIFTRYPFSSADSSNAVRNRNQIERFGYYPPPTEAGRAIAIAQCIESHHAPAVWLKPGGKQLPLFSASLLGPVEEVIHREVA